MKSELWHTVRVLGIAAIAVSPFFFFAQNIDGDELQKGGASAMMVAVATLLGKLIGVGGPKQ